MIWWSFILAIGNLRLKLSLSVKNRQSLMRMLIAIYIYSIAPDRQTKNRQLDFYGIIAKIKLRRYKVLYGSL